MKLFLMVLCIVCLQACTTQYSLLPRVVGALQTRSVVPGDDGHIPTAPNLAYRYMRVDIEGRTTALMVLAFEDVTPSGAVEVWYSASGQMIKTRNSRVIATSGLDVNWVKVVYQPSIPPWNISNGHSVEYTRQRDEMPGYRFAIVDQLKLVSVNKVPDITLPQSLPPNKASTYQWFQESGTPSHASALPPSWYAWGMHRGQATVVYSEQCLSSTFCLKLQRWPVQDNL